MSTDGTICIVTRSRIELVNMLHLLSDSHFAIRTYSHGQTFLEATRAFNIKCALVDFVLPDMTGFEILENLSAVAHDFPVLMINTSVDVGHAASAMKLGAKGVISKPFTRQALSRAIDLAMTDGREDGRAAEQTPVESAENIQSLTRREREVLILLINGYQNKMIGYELGISQRTVEVHRARLMRRLNVKTFADLIRLTVDKESILSEGTVRSSVRNTPQPGSETQSNPKGDEGCRSDGG